MLNERCLICKDNVIFRKIVDVKGYELQENFYIVECPRCGIKKTCPVPADLSVFYKDNPYNTEHKSKLNCWLKDLLAQQEIKRIIANVPIHQFLDLGSGTGRFAYNLFKTGYDVVAADSFQKRPLYIQSLNQIPYRQFDYESLSIEEPQKSVNGRTIIVRHVLEHIKDPARFLTNFIEQGASAFYIVVPNANYIGGRPFYSYNGFWNVPHHIWHFDQKNLLRLLENLNLEVIHSGYDTIPLIGWYVAHYLRTRNKPEWIKNSLGHWLVQYIVFYGLNLFVRNNVLWVVARVKQS